MTEQPDLSAVCVSGQNERYIQFAQIRRIPLRAMGKQHPISVFAAEPFEKCAVLVGIRVVRCRRTDAERSEAEYTESKASWSIDSLQVGLIYFGQK